MILEGDVEKGDGESLPVFGLSTIALSEFRNYEAARISPAPGINVVSGLNAQGKTSLLEAVSLLSTGRLLRSSRDALAIRHGQDRARVTGELIGVGTTITVELIKGARKRVELNGLSLPRASDVIGRLPTVSFSASDLCIVTGEPSDRRQFLDWELAQLYPSYLRHLTVYKRALEQRNALLKQAQGGWLDSAVFEPWEQHLSQHGSSIRNVRRAWIKEISPLTSEAQAAMGRGERLELKYEVRDEAQEEEQLLTLFQNQRLLEIARGSTLYGPHRDDLGILIDGTEAKNFGSQGQQRTAVISIKLSVLESAQSHLGGPPVLLLDDVFSDLDASRRKRLVEQAVHRGGQVFLTCTEPDQAGEAITSTSAFFRVDSGRIVEP